MTQHSLNLVSIRRAQPDDQRALDRLHVTTTNLMNTGTSYTYLAEDSEPFGFVTVGGGEIIALYVKPDYRGLGMGSKLLVRGLSVLKLIGFESALAWIPVSGVLAEKTFASLKFEADGSERYSYPADGSTQFERGYRLGLSDYF